MIISRRTLPYVALLAGIFALSMSSIFIRWANAPGLVTSFYRMAIASLVMLPFFIKSGLPALRTVKKRWLLFPLVAGFFITIDHGTWSTSIAYTSVANSTLFNNIAPVWVAFVAWIFWRERLGWVFWVGLLLTIGGAAIIFGEKLFLSGQFNPGDGLAILSSVFYAGYFLVTQRGREKLPTLPYIWLAGLSGAFMLFLATQLFGMSLTGYPPLTYVVFLAAALISQVGGYFSIGYALGHVPASVVAPTLVAQPVLTMFLAIPMTGEIPQPGQWLGALAVVIGIYLVNRRPATANKPAEQAPI